MRDDDAIAQARPTGRRARRPNPVRRRIISETRHPFAIPDFRVFWLARICSTLAQNGMIVVIGWQVYDIARRTMGIRQAALQLGLIGLAQFVPLFALVLVTGWTADRIDRRRIAQATTSLQLVCAATLFWANSRGSVDLGLLFAVAVMLGIARAFSMPAMNALAPNLVPPASLPHAIAINSIATRAGGIVGPALAGYLYAWHPELPHAFDAGLFATAITCIAFIGPLPPRTIDRSRNAWRQMIEGLAYMRQNRLVLGAISLDLFAVLLGGATAMLPVYAHDILGVGPSGLGHLRAAPALGALLTATAFSFRPLRTKVGVRMLIAVAIYGAATIVFGLSRSITLSLLSLVLLGAADMFSVFVRQSLIQMSTPDAMRGRVGAVSTLFVSASNELGEAESGFLAALIGPVAAVVAGGAGAIAVTLVWARLFPTLRRAEGFEMRED